MEKTLHLDLTENATRRFILATLKEQLGNRAIDVEAATAAACVPGKHHHDLGEVLETIDALQGVSTAVRQNMRGIYRILAEAEASVHGCEVDHTHFHEVGNAEAIECVLQICLALEELAPTKITATPVQVGSGQVQCAHGVLDVPAPATAAILERGIPVCETRLEGELCTPTSAALICHFVDEFEE